MAIEFCGCKWLDENTAIRRTNEVDLRCEVIKGGVFEHSSGPVDGWTIKLTGTADLEHHLVEDAAILLAKMMQKKCGEGHGSPLN